MRLGIFAFLVAILLPTAALAQGEFTTDPYGASGFASLEVRCYGDRYVVGVNGARGTIVDRIQLQCAKIDSTGNAMPTDMASVPVGGNGGAPATVGCSPNAYVRAIRVTLNQDKKQVREFTGNCRDSTGGGAGFTIGGPSEGLSLIPGQNYIWYRYWECPANMAVVGLKVNYGAHVNAIGVICAAIVRQPAPVAVAPPPGPARTGRVVTSGKPKNGAPAPVIKYPSLVGTYGLVSRSGNKLTLFVSEGDGNDLFGRLTSSDSRFNGTFVGTALSGRKFKFTYRDTATGKTGSGTMTYNGQNGDAIIGVITSDGPPPFGEVWGGKRQ